MMTPVLNELAAELGERVNDKLVWRQSGVVSKNQLINVLFQNI